jgi:hypothetical protein
MTLTGVMLGVVLFALSAGYWRGGELSSRWDNQRTRKALTRNLLLAGVIYAAVSFPLEALLLEKVLDAGFPLSLSIGVAATLLFVLPVYLASQTVPMLAELINSEGKAGKASAKSYSSPPSDRWRAGSSRPFCLSRIWVCASRRTSFAQMLVSAAGVMAAGFIQPIKIAGGRGDGGGLGLVGRADRRQRRCALCLLTARINRFASSGSETKMAGWSRSLR